MIPQKLQTFDFPTKFEAASFALDIRINRSDPQQYSLVVTGWEPMLREIALAIYPQFEKPEGVTPGALEEIVSHGFLEPDAWDWASTSDMEPYRYRFSTAPTGIVQVTVLRLFQNAPERVLFQHAFPGGQRPGEAEPEFLRPSTLHELAQIAETFTRGAHAAKDKLNAAAIACPAALARAAEQARNLVRDLVANPPGNGDSPIDPGKVRAIMEGRLPDPVIDVSGTKH